MSNWYKDLYNRFRDENKELKERLKKIQEMADACMVCESNGCSDCDLIRKIKELSKDGKKES